MHPSIPRPLWLPSTAALLLVAACQHGSHAGNPAIDDVHISPPTATATEAVNLPGLHNVVTYGPDLYCGGVPEGLEGFRSLAALGVRTVISVDGATPDVQAASANGLRYVHLPISYDTVTEERQVELAQAIHNLPRPIYVHCHHGKHRSAAALGTALVKAGCMTTDEVVARMRVSGTAASYEGLWQAVRTATPLAKEQLRRDPASFPSTTEVTGMVATMAEIDQVIDLVRQAHEANWQAPDDHPDLVASKETRRLADLFQRLQQDDESRAYPAPYQRLLGRSIELTRDLDQAVRGRELDHAGQLLAQIGKTCKQCHRSYRNK